MQQSKEEIPRLLSGSKTACIVRKRQKTVFMLFIPDGWSEKHVWMLWKILKWARFSKIGDQLFLYNQCCIGCKYDKEPCVEATYVSVRVIVTFTSTITFTSHWLTASKAHTTHCPLPFFFLGGHCGTFVLLICGTFVLLICGTYVLLISTDHLTN